MGLQNVEMGLQNVEMGLQNVEMGLQNDGENFWMEASEQ
jgi:hypothetical protein